MLYASMREHEILIFLGVIIIWKNRKASNWLHYLANVFLFSKMANIFLFLRAEPFVGTIYVLICIVHAVLFPEPAYKGPERVTYFNGAELYEEIQKNKRVTWLVQFYTTWSPECKHIAPVFSQLSDRFALPNLRFAKLDVGRWAKEGERFRINTHPASRQLPTENCILEFDINNLYNECKTNLGKHSRHQMQKEGEEAAKKNA
ncbi:unnamed protein product [Anisakis simplex]|uniref:Thioredoxin-related transmembrane protein 2 homolog (inferred by orthology to a C. elegans protein) n=1 Tax=Anisakis simplex TaxID=6269 RepID=A0A0M3KGA1_ANISI|nr:unnamed protein product [Anisakis simplex]